MDEHTFTLINKKDSDQECQYSVIEWRDVVEKRIGELFPHAQFIAFDGQHATVTVDDVPYQIAYALLFADSYVR